MQRLRLYWTLLILAWLPTTILYGQDEADKFYEKGIKSYEKGDYEKALDYFVRSIEESDSTTSNEETFKSLGKAYYALQKQYSGLLEEEVVKIDIPKVKSVEEIVPSDADTEAAVSKPSNEKVDGAEKAELILEDAADETAAASAYQGGVVAYKQSDYVAAIQYFTIVIESGGENAEKALNYRGMCYHALKDYAAAIMDYDSTIELDEESYIAYHNRGISKQSSKLYNEALIDYNKTIQLNPDYSRAYESRALLYYKMGDNQKALNDCDKILELNADNVNAKKLKEKLQEENE